MMVNITMAFVVDHNVMRRAEACHIVSTLGLTALPIDNIDELETRWPEHGCFLVGDYGSLIDEIISASKCHGRYLPVIAYKAGPAIKDVSSALQVGSADYLQWPLQKGEVMQSLAKIESDWENLVGARDRKFAAAMRLDNLTGREFDVLLGMAEGLASKEIASSLGISPRTVEIHRSNMKLRLDVRNSVEATRIAFEGLRYDETGLTRSTH